MNTWESSESDKNYLESLLPLAALLKNKVEGKERITFISNVRISKQKTKNRRTSFPKRHDEYSHTSHNCNILSNPNRCINLNGYIKRIFSSATFEIIRQGKGKTKCTQGEDKECICKSSCNIRYYMEIYEIWRRCCVLELLELLIFQIQKTLVEGQT